MIRIIRIGLLAILVFVLSAFPVFAHHDDPVPTQEFIKYWHSGFVLIEVLSYTSFSLTIFLLISYLLRRTNRHRGKRRIIITSLLVPIPFMLFYSSWHNTILYPGYTSWTSTLWYLDVYLSHPTLYAPEAWPSDAIWFIFLVLLVINCIMTIIIWGLFRYILKVQWLAIAFILTIFMNHFHFPFVVAFFVNGYRLVYPFTENKYQHGSFYYRPTPSHEYPGTESSLLTLYQLQFQSPQGWWFERTTHMYHLHPHQPNRSTETPYFSVDIDSLISRSFDDAVRSFAKELDPDSIDVQKRTIGGFAAVILKGTPVTASRCHNICKRVVLQIEEQRYVIEGRDVEVYEKEFDDLVASITVLSREQTPSIPKQYLR